MFLAITGILAVGILVGTSAAINQQRYRDSVNSLQSMLQDQYSKATNIDNDRDNTWRCDGTAAISQGGATEPRGTSDCIVLGRLISVASDGQTLEFRDVIGRHRTGVVKQANDVDELTKGYSVTASPVETDNETMPWSTTIVKPTTTEPQPTTILIIRSPLSGGMLTFAKDSTMTDLVDLIKTGQLAAPLPLCVSPGVGVAVPAQLGVRLSAFAASQSAVQVAPESDKLCA